MEIRDVIHGNIEIFKHERGIVDSPFFQRLRNIKQLGFAENSYPGATHNRYIHSLGALHLANVVFKTVFKEKNHPKQVRRFFPALRAAALLHDIGHGPLSHTTEFAMPSVDKLDLTTISENRRANHEDYSLKIILQSSLTEILKKAFQSYEIDPIHIACIINESIACPDDFFIVEGTDYRPILHQIISSEIDVDRMDYLVRDSFYSGVSYGNFDLKWLISHLRSTILNGKCYLSLGHKAIYTFDDFLISRFHMFLMVYFHHKSVIFEEMLARYLCSQDCNYEIPSDIESYIFYDDYHLYTHLSQSSNEWARRIYHKNPYKLLVEFHSGIPTGEKHVLEQKQLLEKVIKDLKEKGVDYIVKTTTGEFSKYLNNVSGDGAYERKYPLFVHYHDHYTPEKMIPIEECTDLFRRYPETRSITRVYVP